MSAPVMNTFLNDLLSSSYPTTSSSGSTGSGSGIVNFLNGLDFTNLGGGGSSSTSSGGFLSGIANIIAPGTGTAASLISNLIPGLEGFLQNGFDFTCLGAQAFNKNDLDGRLNMLKTEVSKLNQSDLSTVESLANWCAYQIGWSDKAISQFKSGCSKSLMGKFKTACLDSLNSLKNSFKFSISQATGDSHMGQFTIEKYTLNSSNSSNEVLPQNVTIEQFETEYKPQIEQYALANGLDVTETIQQVYTKFFPDGGIYGSGTLGGDGWNVGVNVGEQTPNYGLYALIAVGGFMAFKMLKK